MDSHALSKAATRVWTSLGSNASECAFHRCPPVGDGKNAAQNFARVCRKACQSKYRSDQSFSEAVLPRRAWSDRFVADAHGSQSQNPPMLPVLRVLKVVSA